MTPEISKIQESFVVLQCNSQGFADSTESKTAPDVHHQAFLAKHHFHLELFSLDSHV